ncbi:30S ribosome-binding factor RbfA [Pseudomonadales bacterium]|nr:30S ribosome-binding factor RbfA [Gammaproteobacteria bacterium]MBT3733690.1 30S ribosome-binding factor RbfA [Gammaproteobacteria bacterium]MDA7726487.1 30S ribosome-binding factor RbfA [Pseudomonadales bacterium]MDA7771403.1 30S ribosome-binding factor RbfA [Pseudomonadales bacterium]MDC1018069.1 30S ribosome-binding factor RbfA [Pseudomonadales bacterium]
MPREFSRGRRVADHIQKELAVLIQQEVKDPRLGLITINEVKVSRDLGFADVYFTSFTSNTFRANESIGEDAETEGQNSISPAEVLENASGFLRSRLAKSLSTRTTPKLRFHYDHTIAQGAKMTLAIKKAIEGDELLKEQDVTDTVQDKNSD